MTDTPAADPIPASLRAACLTAIGSLSLCARLLYASGQTEAAAEVQVAMMGLATAIAGAQVAEAPRPARKHRRVNPATTEGAA